ncbi:Tripartite-type tricarboxylate transporter, receptor component TctC [Enhydrobacter aerosaccus]|uniref:Tripartite-type tricarboxylate transporter, receptor component TctC n=1 Tax=Enhydrobacter aerosaccus TaxID=225324 RepID=A0A1T4TMV6_9HYPH|nr:tripartite tricarboxylate transporter substrate binding protein [Enhydrobacter aerosaccus]SKA41780.1 Tripartite-type tricarboxylate transporter, receptor component TctC [Enhydrobacter aerosaccus]
MGAGARAVFRWFGVLLGMVLPGMAAAGPYPDKPITIVVPFEAGGSTDVSARVVAKALAEVLRQPVVILNQPGAGGRIGTRRVATADPDGYTLLWGSGSTLAVAPVLYPDQTYLVTLEPVALGALQPFVFVTSPETGAKSVADLIALARRKPGVLNFASAGVGSSNHLLGEIFMSATDTRFVHVPYKGATSARDAVIRGDAQLMDEVLAPLLAQIKAGQLVSLFVTSESRDPTLPNVPTAKEVGLPDLSITGFFGLMAPPKTPLGVLKELGAAMKTALASEEVRKSFANMSFDVGNGSASDLATLIVTGRARYARIVAERQIKVE